MACDHSRVGKTGLRVRLARLTKLRLFKEKSTRDDAMSRPCSVRVTRARVCVCVVQRPFVQGKKVFGTNRVETACREYATLFSPSFYKSFFRNFHFSIVTGSKVENHTQN